MPEFIGAVLQRAIGIVNIAYRVADAIDPRQRGHRNLSAIIVIKIRAVAQSIHNSAYAVQSVVIIRDARVTGTAVIGVSVILQPVAGVVSERLRAAGGHPMTADLVEMAAVVGKRLVAAIGIIDPRDEI